MPAAPAIPTPLRTIGQAGIFPSPGREPSGVVGGGGAAPAVVGGRVPATVVGAVLGGVVLDRRVVGTRRRVVRGAVGAVMVAGAAVGGVVAAVVGAWVSSVVGTVI
jgi:hypothetical protein